MATIESYAQNATLYFLRSLTGMNMINLRIASKTLSTSQKLYFPKDKECSSNNSKETRSKVILKMVTCQMLTRLKKILLLKKIYN